MQLTRHSATSGIRWALDNQYLPGDFSLGKLLTLPFNEIADLLSQTAPRASADGELISPLEPMHEVWACGVTYLRSREAREMESETADVYTKVYNAARPEIFFKSIGWRVAGHRESIRIRKDSRWNVPEAELTLVINSDLEIVGYCAGNDVSSRDIEGQNPLYLPQAKVYDRSCAIGPAIMIVTDDDLDNLQIELNISRGEEVVFQGETSTAAMKRNLNDLVTYLGSELSFPQGVFLMTGTGIVPPDNFSLRIGDVVSISVGALTMTNTVAR